MTHRAHWRLLLNGKAAGNDALRTAVAELRKEGIQLEVRVTWEAGDAERHVTEAIHDGADVIVAGGGDGTLRAVAGALARRDGTSADLPALGLVPLGTANDFAVAAGIPESPSDALRLIGEAPAVPIDLLRIRAGERTYWVANLASGGFGTEVTTHTREALKTMLGGLAYVVSGLGQLGRIEPQHARLTGPGFEWEGDFIALGIGNGRQAGGGQVLCPQAWIDDGLLDLTIVPPLEGELAATLGTAMLEGRDAALERVAIRARLPWLEVTSATPRTLNLDGEPLQARQFYIECVPARLRMHLPSDCRLRRNPAKVSS
ncbi:MAG: lipid kinase YegS [Thermomonas sp.]